mmetsp:Transcript_137704/g.427836  ORF Transcript_137704/g.427836 Transcript_137704/m.427836 type:complete len:222 (-) Transcript_137704:7-672(-)
MFKLILKFLTRYSFRTAQVAETTALSAIKAYANGRYLDALWQGLYCTIIMPTPCRSIAFHCSGVKTFPTHVHCIKATIIVEAALNKKTVPGSANVYTKKDSWLFVLYKAARNQMCSSARRETCARADRQAEGRRRPLRSPRAVSVTWRQALIPSFTISAMAMAEVVEYLKLPEDACDTLYKRPTNVEAATKPSPASAFAFAGAASAMLRPSRDLHRCRRWG